MPKTHILCALLVASGPLSSYMKFHQDWTDSKNCMAKFRIWPPNFFGGLNQKSASHNKVEMQFRVDSENFMQKF